MDKTYCKFCGKEISGEKYLNPEDNNRSCGQCTSYCMNKCEKNKQGLLSWHYEPCKSCPENPYNKKRAEEL